MTASNANQAMIDIDKQIKEDYVCLSDAQQNCIKCSGNGKGCIFDDGNNKVQIDKEGKEAYVYHDYQAEKDIFMQELCQVAKLLENNTYQYTFVEFTKMNGLKVAHFKLEDQNSTYDVWIDRTTGIVQQIDYVNKTQEDEWFKKHYRYSVDSVTDDQVKKPDLTDYEIIDL